MERRSHARSKLHIPALLVGPGCANGICTQTEDISKGGFFTCAEYDFEPGERLKFVLLLPESLPDPQPSNRVTVYGEAQVVRVVEALADARRGVGCRLIHYQVLPGLSNTEETLIEQMLLEIRKTITPGHASAHLY